MKIGHTNRLTTTAAATSIAAVLALSAGPATAQTRGHAADGPGTTTTALEAHEPANTTQQVAALTQPAVSFIETTWEVFINDGSGWLNDGYPFTTSSGCTGFVVDPSGYIVTAGHCVDPEEILPSLVAEVVTELSGTYSWEDGTVLTDRELFEFAMANWTFEGLEAGSAPDLTVEVWLAGEVGGGVRPARLIDASDLEDGTDVALLKVEADNLLTIELSSEEPTIGQPVMSIGYPGSTEDVSDAQTAPSFMSGNVTSVRTRGDGLLPVYEVDAVIAQGMSGGPTVDLSGRVIGLNSYGAADETQDISFVQPASLIDEMLDRNGVSPEPSAVDRTYRTAVAAYFAGEYDTALEGLDSVLASFPDHTLARSLRAEAAARSIEEPDAGTASTGPADPAEQTGPSVADRDGGAIDVRTSSIEHDSSSATPNALVFPVAGTVVVAALALLRRRGIWPSPATAPTAAGSPGPADPVAAA